MIKKAVKIFLINAKNELLLYLRDNNPLISSPGHWDLIGGGVEENESDMEALEREIKEEINIKVENIKYINDIWHEEENNGEMVHMLLFKGNIEAVLYQINLTEGQKLGFFKLEDLNKLKIPKVYLNFIEKNKIID